MKIRSAEEIGGTLPDQVPKPSALRVAMIRAAHQLLDVPIVFEDPFALKILGVAAEDSLRSDPLRYNTPLLKALRASLVVRSRLAEEEWACSKNRGVRQYVILGAGLDTFAYRSRDQAGGRVFEVDLPETQFWKRGCLRAAGINEPESLTFVPMDFEQSTLAEKLGEAQFCLDEPAFFSWLGVTMYLGKDAFVNTLRFIASLAGGSGVVFDYGVTPGLLSAGERAAVELVAARAAEHGESWKSLFDPASIAEILRSQGFSELKEFGPEELNDRYFSGRTDGLRKSGISRLICARL
ncbi:MAG: SAM-dependent methyltransferase [Verrucomicrobia bacterium]|nr:SAM-dependent methyltransferase [Verrucomicrobiota bacterium]